MEMMEKELVEEFRRMLKEHGTRIKSIALSAQLKRTEEQSKEVKRQRYQRRKEKTKERFERAQNKANLAQELQVKAKKVTIECMNNKNNEKMETIVEQGGNDIDIRIYSLDHTTMENHLIESVMIERIPDSVKRNLNDVLLMSQNQRNLSKYDECVEFISSLLISEMVYDLRNIEFYEKIHQMVKDSQILNHILSGVVKWKIEANNFVEEMRLIKFFNNE